jgi:hypothetical protein
VTVKYAEAMEVVHLLDLQSYEFIFLLTNVLYLPRLVVVAW